MGKVVILVALLVQGSLAGRELKLDDVIDNTTNNVKMTQTPLVDSLESKEKLLSPIYEHSTEEHREDILFDQESEENIESSNILITPELINTSDIKKSEDFEVNSSIDKALPTSNLTREKQMSEHSTEENSEENFFDHDSEENIEPFNILSTPDLVNASDTPKSQYIEGESSIDKFLPSINMTPEEQISEIQAASKRLAQCIEREFAGLESMFTSGKRNKREVSEITGNKYLMRLLKHIRANNEHQNLAIDKMMSAREIADTFGIDLTPDFESNEVSFKDNDLSFAASEETEEVSSDLQEEKKVEKSYMKATNEIPAEQPTLQNVFTQQYYYDTSPFIPQTSHENTIPEGAYYYYQVDAPIESNTERPNLVQESTQIHETVIQPQNNEPYQSTAGIFPENTIEQPAMPFIPQGTSERVNPFYYQESSTPVIELVSTQAQEPVAFGLDFQEEVGLNVTTEEIEEKVVSEATTEQENGLKVTHINRSSMYRFSHTSAIPHHHTNINTLPQQYQYYFSLA